jgi:hypothetical protein
MIAKVTRAVMMTSHIFKFLSFLLSAFFEERFFAMQMSYGVPYEIVYPDEALEITNADHISLCLSVFLKKAAHSAHTWIGYSEYCQIIHKYIIGSL